MAYDWFYPSDTMGHLLETVSPFHAVRLWYCWFVFFVIWFPLACGLLPSPSCSLHTHDTYVSPRFPCLTRELHTLCLFWAVSEVAALVPVAVRWVGGPGPRSFPRCQVARLFTPLRAAVVCFTVSLHLNLTYILCARIRYCRYATDACLHLPKYLPSPPAALDPPDDRDASAGIFFPPEKLIKNIFFS